MRILYIFIIVILCIFTLRTIFLLKDASASFTPIFQNIGNVFIDGEKIKLGIEFSRFSTQRERYYLSIDVRDLWGKEAYSSGKNMMIASEGKSRFFFEPAIKSTGWFCARVSLFRGDEKVRIFNKNLPFSKDTFTFAVLPKMAGSVQDSPFGICEHHFNEQNMRLIQLAGIKWIRTDVFWENVQKNRESYDWNRLDNICALSRKHALRVLLIVDYTAPWASTAPLLMTNFKKTRYASLPNYYRAFLSKLILRYKDYVKHWEIWNEPNSGFWKSSREDYIKLLKVSNESIKKEDPGSLVLMGGIAGVSIDWLDMLEAKGGMDHFDVFNIHPYHYTNISGKKLEADLMIFFEKLRTLKKKPVWISEVGSPTNVVSLERQASSLIKDAVLSLSYGVKKIFWYELADLKVDRNDNEANFGILFNDLSPKPSYVAYAILTRILDDVTFDKKLELGVNDVYCFSFSNGVTDILIAWAIKKADNIKLNVGVLQVEAIDIMGNGKTIKSKDGIIDISLTDNPIYLIIQKEAAVTI